MNDVAPPLYGDGLPIASVHHHQQQQHPAEDANVKRFELEPVRESARGTDRGVTIQRTAAEKQRRLQWQIQESHLLSLFLPLSLSLSATNQIVRSTNFGSRLAQATPLSSR